MFKRAVFKESFGVGFVGVFVNVCGDIVAFMTDLKENLTVNLCT